VAFEGPRLIAMVADASQSFPLVLMNQKAVVMKMEVQDRMKKMISDPR
jgi:hypothetical protein